MKKSPNLLFSILFALIIISCSSDPEVEQKKVVETPPPTVPIPDPIPEIEAKITAYSSNYGKPSEQITITGENFSDKIENTKLYFDGIEATIISATPTAIKFTLPATTNMIPQLRLVITNTKITNTVKNAYKGNIAILNANPASSWIVSNSPTTNSRIIKIQILDNGSIYYNYEVTTALSGGSTISFNYVKRSLDGGKTWETWAETASSFGGSLFFATNNDEGWSIYGSADLYKIPMGGVDKTKISSSVGWIVYMNVDETLKKGTIVNLKGGVYTTDDGTNFTKAYNSIESTNIGVNDAYYLDNDHIWAYGYRGATVSGSFNYVPFIMYKKSSSDNWQEKIFMDKDAQISTIQFFKDNSGLILMSSSVDAKILKSNDGGDNWSEIYKGEKFTNMTFIDPNNGWAVLKEKIYKTTDGGVSWTLDYTNDEEILKIASKDKFVIAISKSKIIKRYL
ncbi:IPT/TIG domain-containing protein [Flavobacterium sp.]|uniref:IPT/TIG domain-containing protein n=1 Tax=Flavobacterium sp. TaxID=239 RepID=UPI002B8CB994|nr:IPT/TIG domain-containing protein [Flavobacterium sp.]HSD08667.1 IPT/TIG domain-containing protein [Flavobacterium sp.]